jgi:predicted small secreted protein
MKNQPPADQMNRGRTLLAALMLAAGAAIAVPMLASCSTTQGFGEDVKNMGSGIEDSAERNK